MPYFILRCALVAYGGGRLRADLLVQFSRLTGETVRKIMTLTRQPLGDGMACLILEPVCCKKRQKKVPDQLLVCRIGGL